MRDRERTLEGLQARVFDLCQAGHIAAAKDCLADYTALADEVRQLLYTHWAVGWAAAFAQMEGRFDEAERLATESLELRRRMQTADAESVFAAQLFMIRMGQGRLGELAPAVEQLTGEYPALAAWRAALPLAYLAAGREDDAVAELERFVARLHEIPQNFFWLTAIAVAAEASGKLGHRESADVFCELLEPYSACFVMVGYAGCLGPVSRMLGLLAAARGDRDAAVTHLEDALARSEAAGRGHVPTQARGDLEELLTPSG
jgi:tetratricopeptide (TPR) repeat protein